MHKATKNRIKQLLLDGKNQSAIAVQLSLPVSRVRKLKQEIIQDRTLWNKKKKLLLSYHMLIANYRSNGWNARKIHTQLVGSHIRLSYSTVARFVAGLKKAEVHTKISLAPGVEAKVFFIPIGKFSKEGKNTKVWVFMMKLTYSKYCFCIETTDCNFENFLQCHKKAFSFFQSVPQLIKLNRTRAFNINDPLLKERYTAFLAPLGIKIFEKRKRNCFIDCPSEVRFFKEQFLFRVLHRNYHRLSKDLKHWYSCEINLGIHPITKKIIEKEFLCNEQPAMAAYSFR